MSKRVIKNGIFNLEKVLIYYLMIARRLKKSKEVKSRRITGNLTMQTDIIDRQAIPI